MKIDKKTGLPAIEFTDLEAALDRVEESWADCAAGFRTVDGSAPYRRSRAFGDTEVRCRSLLEVYETLEKHRADYYSRRNPAGLFDAMLVCAEENLPLPYWAAELLLLVADHLANEPQASLHTELGLDERFPLSEKKALKAHRNRDLEKRLYMLVSQHPKARQSLDAAIKGVLDENDDLRVVFSVRKAKDVYEKILRAHTRYF